MRGTIFDIKEMAVHDGPGIRTTIFFKGCPLRCKWCHNPEGLSQKPQLMYKKVRCIGCMQCNFKCEHEECQEFGRCIHRCPENCIEIIGRNVETGELTDKLKRNAEVLGEFFGGFTFSGGEPLMQYEFLIELARSLKPHHLCVETSGYADEETFKKCIKVIDFVIMDIKLADDEQHIKYTGVSNKKILKNIEYLKRSGKEFIFRTPLIPGITDTEDNLTKIKQIVGDNIWEKLPYNEMAGAKYEMLSMEYTMK